MVSTTRKKTTELLKYMTVIRGAVGNHPIQMWTTYNTQFMLRKQVLGYHCWTFLAVLQPFRRFSAIAVSSARCYEYDFKSFFR